MTTIPKSLTVDTPVVGTHSVSTPNDSSISISGAAVLVAIQLELLEIFMKNSKLMNEIASKSNQIAMDAAMETSEMVEKAGQKEAEMIKMQAAALVVQATVCIIQAVMQFGTAYNATKNQNKTLGKENEEIKTTLGKINSPDTALASESTPALDSTPAAKAAIRDRIDKERLYNADADGNVTNEFTDEEIATIKSDDKLKKQVIGHLEKRKDENTRNISDYIHREVEHLQIYLKIADAAGKVAESSTKFVEANVAVEKAECEALRTYMQSVIDILKSSANQGTETRQDLLSKVQQILDLLEKLDSTNRFQR
jgi:hypothetical protein